MRQHQSQVCCPPPPPLTKHGQQRWSVRSSVGQWYALHRPHTPKWPAAVMGPASQGPTCGGMGGLGPRGRGGGGGGWSPMPPLPHKRKGGVYFFLGLRAGLLARGPGAGAVDRGSGLPRGLGLCARLVVGDGGTLRTYAEAEGGGVRRGGGGH